MEQPQDDVEDEFDPEDEFNPEKDLPWPEGFGTWEDSGWNATARTGWREAKVQSGGYLGWMTLIFFETDGINCFINLYN